MEKQRYNVFNQIHKGLRAMLGWLSGIKQGAPAQVFNAYYQLAGQELPSARLAKVHAALENV